jgi:hypothetical protein
VTLLALDQICAAAGDASFPGGPFEQRFRHIPAGSRQARSRDMSFETRGRTLLGNSPEVFL